MKTQITLIICAVIIFYCPWHIAAQTLDKKFMTTNGPVSAIVQNGDTVYVGGSFSKVGTGVQGTARIKKGSTDADFSFPEAGIGQESYCRVMEPDGNGGTYMGGYFHSYKGVPLPLTRILHVLSDGSLDPAFGTVTVPYIAPIETLKKKGNRLYVSGSFDTIQGIYRPYLAALNAVTGALENWVPDAPNRPVYKIDANDSLLFIQGDFDVVGGYLLPYQYAVLSTNTGKLVNGFPVGGTINSFRLDSNILYMAGNFTALGRPASGLAGVSAITAKQNVDYPMLGGVAKAILPDKTGGFYIAGSFGRVGNIPRNNLAHILADGALDTAFHGDPNGDVLCLATDGVNLYLGGNFSTVNGSARRNMASVNLQTGEVTSFKPDPDNTVYAIACSSDGAVYFGGSFLTVSGASRKYVASVKAGQLTAWKPNPSDQVRSIAVDNAGTFVYIGGLFVNVQGLSFPRLAKVNNTDGAPVASWRPVPSSFVYTMVLDKNVLYIGGFFTALHGVSRLHLAGVDTGSGIATSFKADLNNNVNSIYITGGKLYVAGAFTTVEGIAREHICRVDIASGLPDSWNNGNVAKPDNYVDAIAANKNTVLFGGNFYNLNVVARRYMAAVNLANPSYPLTTWNPDMPGAFIVKSIQDIVHNGRDIMAAGDFQYEYIKGSKVYMNNLLCLSDSSGQISRQFKQKPDNIIYQLTFFDNDLVMRGFFSNFYNYGTNTLVAPRHYLAAYNLTTNSLSAKTYEPDEQLSHMTTTPSGDLLLSGEFKLFNCMSRINLAAIDLNSGSLTSWNPAPDYDVYALAIKDSTLYAGGAFGKIGVNAAIRQYIGAVNIHTGLATAWNANTNGYIVSLSLKDSVLYAAGSFSQVRGITQSRCAALSTTDGTVGLWNPKPDNDVYSILAVNDDVYIGGRFFTLDGQYKPRLAKCNNTTGAANAWTPAPDNQVYTMQAFRNHLYVGGDFDQLGGGLRYGLAAFDTGTDNLLAFDAMLNNNNGGIRVNSVAPSGKSVFLATQGLSSIGTAPRSNLASVDTATATATPFNPSPNSSATVLSAGKDKLFAGGNWSSLRESISPAYFAVFTLEPEMPARNLVFTNLTTGSVTAGWTNGSGENRIVVVKQGGKPAAPADGKFYAANAIFGYGDTTGNKSYTVYNGNSNTVNISGLLPNHTYGVSVFEYNGAGAATEYQQTSALTRSITTLCPSFTVSIDSSGTLDLCPGKTVTLSAPAGFINYLWSNGSSNDSVIINAAGSYTVTVSDSNNCKVTSPPVSVTVRSCISPVGLSTTNISATGAKANWLPNDCAVGYSLEARPKGATTWQTITVPATRSSYTANGLAPGKTYQWRIATVCQANPLIISPYSTIQNFTTLSLFAKVYTGDIQNATGTFEWNASVSPNPATKTVTVQLNKITDGVQIQLTDLSGKVLWQMNKVKDANITIPVDKLANGIYLVVIKDKEHQQVVRLVKQ